jgi:hypothetical protein
MRGRLLPMSAVEAYQPLGGVRHRHGELVHEHPHAGPHGHHSHGHSHSHGLVDDSIKRSREGVRAVVIALAVLGLTALVQAAVFVASGSVALLADLIHNAGDAATAIPLGIAFALRSARAERWAGLAVVLAIFVSAVVAGYEAVYRLVEPREVEALVPLALAGAIGFGGNCVAAIIRTRAGRRLDSPALIADGARARGCVRLIGGDRQRRGRSARSADRRPADRSCDHGRDSPDHAQLVAHRPWRAPSLKT